ncbi:MAG: T9SS type A sorting domain-containing protein [Flavobacteriaceae bacterium]|nr:T9SS type A sorting domain-containing protein [Flavobacteriaceae bacterium]
MKLKTTLLSFVLFISFYCHAQDWKTYPYTPSGSLVSFSEDEGRHSTEPIEWWYTTGHITGSLTGNNYSYMLSYFYYPTQGYDGFRILNLTNDDTGQNYFDTKPVDYDILALDKLDIQASSIFIPKTESWKNKKDGNNNIIPFEYDLFAATSSIEINFSYNTTKRPLILGDDGKFDQGLNSYTYYYSQTKNEVSGSITINGISENITGSAWIDRQYGSFNPLEDEKYEWFSLQLSNGMDINLWNLFTDNNEIPNNLNYKILSAYVDENTQYTNADFNLERLAFNCTPEPVNCYAKKWRLTADKNNIDLVISVLHLDSEVQLPFRFYEGSTTITGTINGVSVTGKGFAELLHSYEKPNLTLTNPIDDTFNSSENITWNLNNEDDGNPLLYDVAYSIDNKQNYQTIAQGISETSFLWENPDIPTGEIIWFKITAYSVDLTLETTIISSSSSFTLPVDLFSKFNVVLFPNPSSSALHIDLNEVVADINYQITDINGKILLDKNIQNISTLNIDIKLFKPGLYFLKIRQEKKIMYTKFIKN